MTTVVGLFDRYEEADRAYNLLVANGFDRDQVGLLMQAREGMGESSQTLPDQAQMVGGGLPLDSALAGTASGAAVGGLAGLLLGIGVIAIPGIGPALAVGTLAAALGSTAAGAAVGATTGGVIGLLVGLGVTESEAHVYAEGIKRGGVLVAVKSTPERAAEASRLLREASAVDIQTRGEDWRGSGWTGFEAPREL